MDADLVVRGDVVLAAGAEGLETAEAIAVASGRVVAAGTWAEVSRAASSRARVLDMRPAAVIPGLHDFHVHLVGLARSRAEVALDDAADAHEIAARLRAALDREPDGWITGRGWSEAQLRDGASPVRAAVGASLVFLSSHDGHSAWASPAALRMAGIDAASADPPGGRIERDSAGLPTGVLRETALDLVDRLVPRRRGDALRPHLDAVLDDLAAMGITGVSEAGDYTDEGGDGPDAALGDSYSTLTDLADALDGRLRMNLGIPVDAIPAAAERGLRTGGPLVGRRTLRFGWAKEYADGALGSATAAVFEPMTCGDGGTGILRVEPASLDALCDASGRTGISLAVHAIGDRAVATVLDAFERAGRPSDGRPPHRIEHVQLVRAADRPRLATLGVTASVQPIHAAADRDLVASCWRGREADAYSWRSLADAGALLAAGSDAPVESVDPWLGMFAALHRRIPADERGDWTPDAALTVPEALAAYTLGPARAIGAGDEGHLRPGARADLAVLDRPLADLLAGGEGLAGTRSVLTLVDGAIVHEA